jgi:hypothetical protein
MRTKGHIIILIFTIAVLTILVRPYLVYQMTMTCDYKAHPARAWSLMQRLIKKKEEHHEQQAGLATAAVQQGALPKPKIKVLLLAKFYSWLLFQSPVKHPVSKYNTVLLPNSYRYRLVSCFLI